MRIGWASVSAVVLWTLGGCGDEASPPTAGVGPEGGTITLADGATLEIPPGAVPSGVLVEGAVADDAELPQHSGWRVHGRVYAFTPHGTEFNKPVTISIPVVVSGSRVLTLEDESDESWEEVDAVTRGAFHELSVRHISLFAEFSETGAGAGGVGGAGVGGMSDEATAGMSSAAGAEDQGSSGEGGSAGAAGEAGHTVVPRRLCMGLEHGCAIVAEGQVECWGSGLTGALGDGIAYDETNVGRASAGLVTNVTDAVQLSCGDYSVSALLADGRVMGWGRGSLGTMGDGTASETNRTPRPSLVTNAVQISSSGQHVCAVLTDRTVSCWGRGDFGQLGDGVLHASPNYVATPRPVEGLTGVSQVALGDYHSCALLDDRTVKCWGTNDFGQLGDATPAMSPEPVVVPGLAGVRQLTGGDAHTCALLESDDIVCWGLGAWGQLGDGMAYPETAHPGRVQVVGGAKHAWVDAALSGTCSVGVDGGAFCWGVGVTGAIGDGSFHEDDEFVSSPTPVLNLTRVEDLAYCADTACARLADQSVWCWGWGVSGALGNGMFYDAEGATPAERGVATPVRVQGL